MSRMGKPVEIESKFVIEAGGLGSDSDSDSDSDIPIMGMGFWVVVVKMF